MRDTNFTMIDKDIEKYLKDIIETTGEMTQLESAMYLLDGLMGWCEVFFNNDIEVRDYSLLKQSYEILEKVHKSYRDNYN